MSKQYNFYLNSTDASYNTTTCVYTFNVNWSILPQDIDYFDLEVSFNSSGQILSDYVYSTTTLKLATLKVISNLRDAFSYDTNTKSNNSSCLCYVQKTNEYIDGGSYYKGCSYTQNLIQLGQKKTIIRPTDPNLTIFLTDYEPMSMQQTLYGILNLYQIVQIDISNNLSKINPFTIILTLKPIK